MSGNKRIKPVSSEVSTCDKIDTGFVHMVLFKIQPQNVKIYKLDCRLWARQVKKAQGFLRYLTVKRVDASCQYASVYQWKSKAHHDRFMRIWHDQLVARSRCPVKVLGYYNFAVIQKG